MQLEDFKKNMSVLDQVLARTSADIKINVLASETAQSKILRRYRQAFTNCAIVAVVFCCLWIGNVNPDKLPNLYKGYITVLCALASVWYVFLFVRLKKVNIAQCSPSTLFSSTTIIKLLTLSGEIFFGMALAVFFTLLLSEMVVISQLAFWLIIGLLGISITWSAIYIWPRYIKLFNELNTIKE